MWEKLVTGSKTGGACHLHIVIRPKRNCQRTSSFTALGGLALRLTANRIKASSRTKSGLLVPALCEKRSDNGAALHCRPRTSLGRLLIPPMLRLWRRHFENIEHGCEMMWEIYLFGIRGNAKNAITGGIKQKEQRCKYSWNF